MKLNQITHVAVIALAVFSTSCTSNKVAEWRDSNIYQGEGGAVETMNGVELWLKGTPDRKFKVIGFIEHSHGTGGLVGAINSASWKSSVAKKAKELGGDAVIMATRYRELTGYSGNQSGQTTATSGRSASYTGTSSSSANYTDRSEILVVKYVE